MEFEERDEITALRDTLRRFVQRECTPEHIARWDAEDFIPRSVLEQLGELGVCGV